MRPQLWCAALFAAVGGWLAVELAVELARTRAPFGQEVAARSFRWSGPEAFHVDRRVATDGVFGNQEVRLRLRPDGVGLAEITLRQRDPDKAHFEVFVISADPRIPCGFRCSTSVEFGVPQPRMARTLTPGESSDLRLEVVGPRYRAFLNGDLVDETSCLTFATGTTAWAVVSGAFTLEHLDVLPLRVEQPWFASELLTAAALVTLVVMGTLLDVAWWRAHKCRMDWSLTLAAGTACAVIAAWHEAIHGHAVRFAAIALIAALALAFARFALRHSTAHLLLGFTLVASAAVPCVMRATTLPDDRANELPFHYVTGPALPVDLAWYFHPLLRRFNSFLADHTFRKRPHALACQAGAVRIACLGTSSTWGYPLAAGEDYPARLEARLRANGIAADVINAAIPGSAAFRIGKFFDGVVREFHPDIVTIALYFNDSSVCLQLDEQAALAEISAAGFHASWLDRIRKNVAMLETRRAYDHARALFAQEGSRERALDLPIVRTGLDRFARDLTGLVEGAKACGARVVLIKEAARPGAFLKQPMHAVIATVGERCSVPVLDVEREFASRPLDQVFTDWVHPTALGHELIAQQLSQLFQALGWLK